MENDADPTEPKRGWQYRAFRCLEVQHFRRDVWPTFTDPNQALLRSQRGPLASTLTALPTSRATRIDPQPFRVWLCRRLFLPLPLTSRTCCDTACSRLGFWEPEVRTRSCGPVRQRFGPRSLQPIECTPHGRSSLTGCPFGMVRSWLWTPLWCHFCDGSARRNAATSIGVALQAARRAKETTPCTLW